MRKAMLLAAMLAMVLAAAAPAFAQTLAIDEGDDVEYNAVCQNILGAVGDITNTQDGDADAVAQSQGVTIEQVNECLNEADLDGDGFITVIELKKFGIVTAAEVQYGTTVTKTAVLPETGGAP